uniref:Uncharacterized protein n=1 Tax=Arundo donax TaxID=35708 RepID=A0A0A9DEG5_ARUDO
MGKDSKPKDAKGKGKQAAGSSGGDDAGGKGKGGKSADGLGTCTYVKDTYCVRNRGRSMRHTRSCRMDGWTMGTRFLLLNSLR